MRGDGDELGLQPVELRKLLGEPLAVADEPLIDTAVAPASAEMETDTDASPAE